MSPRRILLIVGAVVGSLVVILVLSDPSEDRYERPALDPRGTGPEGTAALVDLLDREGAGVRLRGRPSSRDDVVLQLADTWSGDAAADLESWVRDGGTLVTADPGAALAPRRAVDAVGLVDGRGTCTIDALDRVRSIAPRPIAEHVVGPGTSACFTSTEATAAAVTVRRLGLGLVVTLPVRPLINSNLARADNAGMAVAVLVPWDGARVRVLDPNRYVSDADEGDGTVIGALPQRGSEALSLLVVAFLIWGLIRGRRLGRPVAEELPVPLPASDLVLAAGNLLDRNGAAADAAERLRRRTRRDLGTRLGLGPDPDPTVLAHALVDRGGVDPSRVQVALVDPVLDEAGLVSTTAHLDHLRRDIEP